MTRPALPAARLCRRVTGRGPRRRPARGLRRAHPGRLPGTRAGPAGRGPGRASARRSCWPRTRPPRPPAASPGPSPAPAAASSGTSCGFLDVSCEIGNAITSWFAALARDALRPLLTLAGRDPAVVPASRRHPRRPRHVGDVAGDRRLRVRAAGRHRRGHRDGPRDPPDLLLGQGHRAPAGHRVPGRQPVPGPDLRRRPPSPTPCPPRWPGTASPPPPPPRRCWAP